ncbi:hypothetical protein Gotri_000521 [Gossypium trilobum]|uniref:GTD-binding domain-containing protein n=1 Tax=Gossypium trilobum TaxID=34281 RepID=A0A7J9FBU9_9ROSI|nr:hypothetical protein [Gossypium trilobum]
MLIPGRFILVLITCSVLELHKRGLQVFVAFMMDCASCLKFLLPGNEFFGFGFLVFGRFSHVFNVLGLVFVFGMGFKFLQFGLSNKGIMQFLCDARGKSNDLRGGICSKHDLNEVYDPNITKSIDNCKEILKKDTDFDAKYGVEEGTDEKEKECCPEDEEFDSSVEIDANQFKRMAEQKQEYDQQVIESLQWIVMKHESEWSSLENQLQLCKQKLKLYMEDDELDQFELDGGLGHFHDA